MEENRIPDFDESESIWKIDGPINRKTFIWNTLGIYLLLGCPALLLNIIFGPLLIALVLIMLLVTIWLTLTTLSKRLWDITGSKMWGIILGIIIVISLCIPIIALLALIVAACIPGTCLKVSKK